MSKIKIHILLFCIFTNFAFASFNEIGLGARPLGFGGAFAAISDDSNAPQHNPAGMAFISKTDLSIAKMRYFGGLVDHTQISAVTKFGKIGGFGLSFGKLGEESAIYSERTIRIAYAKSFFDKFAIGLNFKSFVLSLDENADAIRENPYFTATSATANSIDLGAILKPINDLNFGFVAENLIPTNVSISDTNEDKIPINFKFGISYHFVNIADQIQQKSLQNVIETTQLITEIALRNGEQIFRGGVEFYVSEKIALRSGFALKSGRSSSSLISIGATGHFSKFHIHYVFQNHFGNLRDNTSQIISISLTI